MSARPKFSSLASTPLELDRRGLLEAMEPFVARHLSPDDPVWRAAVARKTRNTRLRRWRRRWLGWWPAARRDQRRIRRQYEENWVSKGLARYAPGERPATGSAWRYGDDVMIAQSRAGARARLLVLMRSIAFLRPRSVLEVGSGNGVNLLCLSCRFPAIRFAGVELTEGGVATATAAQAAEALPDALQRFAPEPLLDPSAHRAVEFRRGSAAELPFADASFDLVYSSLALEQMEEVRERAIREMVRVSSAHTLMLEPFLDCNDDGLPRDYVVAYDHFRGRIGDLSGYGLEPIVITDDLPGEIWLRPCLVICRKTKG
jgi:SAM-dependent methyltransferase